MKQILKAGEIIHFHGIPAELLADIEVESATDLRREDLLAQTDAAVKKAQSSLFPPTDNATGVTEYPA